MDQYIPTQFRSFQVLLVPVPISGSIGLFILYRRYVRCGLIRKWDATMVKIFDSRSVPKERSVSVKWTSFSLYELAWYFFIRVKRITWPLDLPVASYKRFLGSLVSDSILLIYWSVPSLSELTRIISKVLFRLSKRVFEPKPIAGPDPDENTSHLFIFSI